MQKQSTEQQAEVVLRRLVEAIEVRTADGHITGFSSTHERVYDAWSVARTLLDQIQAEARLRTLTDGAR